MRPDLILASASPRRREILDVVRIPYLVVKPDIEERPRPGEDARAYVQRNADEKGARVLGLVQGGLLAQTASPDHGGPFGQGGGIILSADTVVVLDGQILEKPEHHAHAVAMLTSLSGREHTVFTGVSIKAFDRELNPGLTRVFVVATSVNLKPLSEREILSYIASGEPLDKAGAYAAQGLGSYMVQRIVGSYANVVGLPIAEVVETLEQHFHYPFWREA